MDDWDKLIQSTIDGFNDFLDLEKRFIKEEHDLTSNTYQIMQAIGFIDEHDNTTDKIHDTTREISDILVEIINLVKKGELKDLTFVKEEEEVLDKLAKGIKHRDWRAVKADVRQEQHLRENVIKLELNELRKLHKLFVKLCRLIQNHVPTGPIVEDDSQIEYYFNQIFKIISTYEKILRDLCKKEMYLHGKFKKPKLP